MRLITSSIVACVLLTGFVIAISAPETGRAQAGARELRERADAQRSHEASLSRAAVRLAALARRVELQLATLGRRRAEVQSELDRDQARLARIQAALRAERIRLTRLRSRLGEARGALRSRLVALYKAPDPDLATLALNSTGFSDLLERTTFLRRISDQDQRIVSTVRAARGDATRAVKAYSRAEANRRAAVAAMRVRRDALASMALAAVERRATLTRARAARLAALQATRTSRRSVERRVRALEAAERRAARARAQVATVGSPGGSWAIPWALVQCESGGQNLPPNSAGASGFYQILVTTWRENGGSGAGAWRASRAEQDRVASRIWAAGSGAKRWVCAGLV